MLARLSLYFQLPLHSNHLLHGLRWSSSDSGHTSYWVDKSLTKGKSLLPRYSRTLNNTTELKRLPLVLGRRYGLPPSESRCWVCGWNLLLGEPKGGETVQNEDPAFKTARVGAVCVCLCVCVISTFKGGCGPFQSANFIFETIYIRLGAYGINLVKTGKKIKNIYRRTANTCFFAALILKLDGEL